MKVAKTSGAVRPENPDAPSPWLAVSELPRAVAELALLASTYHSLISVAARGDGHPVLVLPGLLAGDRSTAVIRRTLRRLGYDARPWRLGANRGARAIGRDGERLVARVEEIFLETGRRVSLVGWSLGGVFARLMARRLPDRIRRVITLGSPFSGSPRATNAAAIYELASATRIDDAQNRALLAELQAPPPVPSSAIYTRGDGVCAWQVCREDAGEQSESIEVYGSHCGLGVNPAVIYAVADRLALDENRLDRFRPAGLAGFFYPASDRADSFGN
jgi:pimeloyl-ACP methyl ester carboxylesterase